MIPWVFWQYNIFCWRYVLLNCITKSSMVAFIPCFFFMCTFVTQIKKLIMIQLSQSITTELIHQYCLMFPYVQLTLYVIVLIIHRINHYGLIWHCKLHEINRIELDNINVSTRTKKVAISIVYISALMIMMYSATGYACMIAAM